jgi:regulatory protein
LKSNEILRQQALKLLARREHSQKELQRKLIKRGAEAEQIELVLQQLVEEKLLSDDRFCEAYIYHRRKAGFGPLRIQAELSERGIHAKTEDQLQNGESWEELLEKTWQKKFKGQYPCDLKNKAKQTRFLINRGFTIEQIQIFWKKIIPFPSMGEG